MSLEYNTTPIIEPYFLSQFKAHSLLGSLAIVTNASLLHTLLTRG